MAWNSSASLSAPSVGVGPSSPSMVFCEELDFSELQLLNIVGQGSFGTVRRAMWREKVVAVKTIEGESARNTFMVEVSQLTRVKHKNIITLYGACMKNPENQVCLVMEYAEGGSLHKVLHGRPRLAYKAAHAISWMLQCAEGVEYLHSLKPKALVHRDLKPLNLLLFDCGRKLKICDFGTACDLHTHMTNNKGSAQWMAPEVFEGSKYSEKCDVFSWGIMLWEVLTRRKPFEDIGGAVYRVMWAVHSGKRPPLIQHCPKPIEILMKQCWDQSPVKRPAMNEVVQRMSHLMPFFNGADEPLVHATVVEHIEEDDEAFFLDATLSALPPAALLVDDSRCGVPIVELPPLPDNANCQQSEDVTIPSAGGDENGRGYELPVGVSNGLQFPTGPEIDDQTVTVPIGCQSTTAPSDGANDGAGNPAVTPYELAAGVPMAFLALDSQFQPLRPYPGSQESEDIFREHCVLAEEYIKIQEEITLLLKRKQDLIMELNNNIKEAHQMSRYQDYQQLLLEKEQMQKLHNALKADLEDIRKQRKM